MSYREILLMATLLVVSPSYSANGQTVPNSISVEFQYGGFTDDIKPDLDHRERNYLVHLGYSLTPRWAVVAQGNIIRSNVEGSPDRPVNNFVVGLVSEVDILSDNKHRLYAQLGVATGNYCTCGRELPSVQPDLVYLRYGLGTAISIADPVAVVLKYEGNPILSRTVDGYDYNVFSIGVRLNNWLKLGRAYN